MTTKPTILTVAVLALLATGCSSSDQQTSAEGDTQQGSGPVISIQEFVYDEPESVTPGAEVTVTNEDSAAHTVTADDGAFDVTVDGDATATFTAPSKPGEYTYVCDFHPDMTGTLVVQ